jgi:hypothetical protein
LQIAASVPTHLHRNGTGRGFVRFTEVRLAVDFVP